MITGLEPAIFDAAVGSATRAIGWGADEVRKSGQHAQMRKLLSKIESADGVPGPNAPYHEIFFEEVCRYLKGPQFAHITYSLATIAVVASSGRRMDQAISTIRAEFEASIELIVGRDARDALVGPIFAAAMYAVTIETGKLGDTGSLPKGIKAEAAKMISSIAAASARNVEILRQHEHVAEFTAFEKDMRAQIRALHGTMKLPHAGTTKQVPYERLFVSSELTFSKSDRDDRAPNAVGIEDIVRHSTRCVILGDPGGGKSTRKRSGPWACCCGA